MLNTYSVDVLVNNKPVTTFKHEGDIYVEGRPGSAYSIRVTNRSYRRIKTVVSVDGLSVMDGQPATDGGSGYLIPAYGSITIDGWRTSDNEVAQFKFGGKKNSYTNKLGEGTANVGVIGVAVFEEEVPSWPVYRTFNNNYNYNDFTPYWTSYNAAMDGGALRGLGTNSILTGSGANDFVAMACAAEPQTQNLGTVFGETKQSRVTEVEFNAKSYAAKTLVVYYDDRKGLEARGIIVDKRFEKPNPFPASTKYCRRV